MDLHTHRAHSARMPMVHGAQAPGNEQKQSIRARGHWETGSCARPLHCLWMTLGSKLEGHPGQVPAGCSISEQLLRNAQAWGLCGPPCRRESMWTRLCSQHAQKPAQAHTGQPCTGSWISPLWNWSLLHLYHGHSRYHSLGTHTPSLCSSNLIPTSWVLAKQSPPMHMYTERGAGSLMTDHGWSGRAGIWTRQSDSDQLDLLPAQL
jgi:hypothetical protein